MAEIASAFLGTHGKAWRGLIKKTTKQKMYSLTDKQIDFILNDISARGIETEDLQYNLLDHICCIIENGLKENGDFEQFYLQTVSSFYKTELRELEDETQLLLTYKNYYAMKKTMFISGFISASFMLFGGFFKIMHWPFCNELLILGIGFFSLLFLPIMFTLKIKEKPAKRDKAILILGLIASVFLLFSALFKIMHWPGSLLVGFTGFGLLLLIFLPMYLLTGLRNPATKVNTIVTSIFIIAGSGFLLIIPNKGGLAVNKASINFLKNEESALSDLRKMVLVDSSDKNLGIVYANFMQSADKLKNAVSVAISEVEYSAYLNYDENIQPRAMYSSQLRELPETNGFINSLIQLEEKLNTQLYQYDDHMDFKAPNRTAELDFVLITQSQMKDLMSFITNTQTKACLALVKR